MRNLEYNGTWETLTLISDKNSYSHISFDFWNTMVFPNPIFKEKRAEFICQLSNTSCSIAQINQAFEKIGKAHNHSIELGGKTASTLNLYQFVFNELGWKGSVDLVKIIQEIEEIFLEYPPILSQDFLRFLNHISHLQIPLSITSNTAFIAGRVIKAFLTNCALVEKFQFFLFSDEVGQGKPSREIFSLLEQKAKVLNPIVQVKDIIHVGDNPLADLIGPMKYGFDSFLLVSEPKLIFPRHAVHSIRENTNYPFSPEEYSKFKFGDREVAAKFSAELFHYFIASDFFENSQFPSNLIIYSSPYSQVPTSSYYLARGFFELLKSHLDKLGVKTRLRFGKINRCQTYTQDYGAMDASERYNLIKNDTYSFSEIPKNEERCIFIDDISITGSHQLVVESMLFKNKCTNESLFLYYAKLDDLSIPASIENELNFFFVDSIQKLLEVALAESFSFTTRMIKYVLNACEEDFELFFDSLLDKGREDLIFDFHKLALSNKYETIDGYQKNWRLLEQVREGLLR